LAGQEAAHDQGHYDDRLPCVVARSPCSRRRSGRAIRGANNWQAAADDAAAKAEPLMEERHDTLFCREKEMPFEFDSRKYAETSAHQKEWGERLISELNLKGNEAILDLGSGDGALTARLAELVPEGKVVGIDASRNMVETARALAKDNLEFLLGDIDEISFEGEFDVVFSNATLHWVKNHDALLDNVRRALKPNGGVRFNFAGDGNCSHLNRVAMEFISVEPYAPYFTGFQWPWYMPTVEEYETLVKSRPFKQAEVWGENADRHFPSAEAMVGWIDQPAIVPFLKCVDEEDKQGFRDAVVDRMLAMTKQHDGTFFETFRRINVLASR